MSFIKLSPSRNAYIALVVAPVAIPAIYLAFLTYNISRNTKSSNGIRRPKGSSQSSIHDSDGADKILPWIPASLPDDVKSDDSDWVLAYERAVSLPIPFESLTLSPSNGTSLSPSPLLRAYTAGAHVAFSSTPQAVLIRAMVDPETKRTFDTSWIQSLQFTTGDVVNGAYRVSYSGQGKEMGSERIELTIQGPPSYKGPVPNGLILSEINIVEGDSTGTVPNTNNARGHVIFINETWMWRKESEKPTLVESKLGGWMHTLMAGWLIKRGVKAVSL